MSHALVVFFCITVKMFTPPQIEKREADDFVPGGVIPQCCVLASCTRDGATVDTLRHVLEISGTQTPRSLLLCRGE